MNIFTYAAPLALLGASVWAQTPSKPVARNASLDKPQTLSSQELNIRAYIELLRTDVKKSKAQIIGEVMQLDADESAKFWPIYKAFENELSVLGDRVVGLLRKYADNYSNLNDSSADEIATQVLQIEQQRNELKKKYYERLKSELGAITAARFLQVENQLERLLDLQIASQLPVIAGQ